MNRSAPCYSSVGIRRTVSCPAPGLLIHLVRVEEGMIRNMMALLGYAERPKAAPFHPPLSPTFAPPLAATGF